MMAAAATRPDPAIVRLLIEKGDFVVGAGSVSGRFIDDDYKEYVRSVLSIPRKLRVGPRWLPSPV